MPWPLLTALAPVIGGLFSAGGQLLTNKSNRAMAQSQMSFQERMSSTAAQRSALDYRAAGLNPALAYERPASSPGGASAMMGDAVGAGISTALDAKRLAKEVALASEQTRAAKATADVVADPMVVRARKDAERKEAQARADVAGITAENAFRDARFQAELQPVQLRLSLLDEVMKKYSVEGLTRTALSKIVPFFASSAASFKLPDFRRESREEEPVPAWRRFRP